MGRVFDNNRRHLHVPVPRQVRPQKTGAILRGAHNGHGRNVRLPVHRGQPRPGVGREGNVLPVVQQLRLRRAPPGRGHHRRRHHVAQPVPALGPGQVQGGRQEEAREGQGGELLLLNRERGGVVVELHPQRLRGVGVRVRAPPQDQQPTGKSLVLRRTQHPH